MKKQVVRFLICFLVAFSFACFDFVMIPELGPNGAEVYAASKAKISKKKVTLYVKNTKKLKIKGAKGKVKWKSSNKKIVKVSSKGKIKALKQGRAKITAKVKGKKYTCKVTVLNPTISALNLNLKVGESKALIVKHAVGTVVWSTSNKAVATVSDKGLVKGNKEGSATITAKASGINLNCKITVIKDTSAGDKGAQNTEVKIPDEPCVHNIEKLAYKEPTCIADGNIQCWQCSKCKKYFSDSDGAKEIPLKDIIIPAKGHTVVIDQAVSPTHVSKGLTEGSHCEVCGAVIVPQREIPMLSSDQHSISYDIANGDQYLENLIKEGKITNYNPSYFDEGYGLTLRNVSVPGYLFEGWYDLPSGKNASVVKKIESGTNSDVELFAHWEKIEYTVQYKSSLFTDEDEAKYTVDKGLVLPTPKLSNYTFAGWADENGKLFKGTKIPVGSTGNKVLTANWTSERNKTLTKNELDDPIILEDEDTNSILFVYEIGEVQNVPLYTIKDFGYISGDGVTKSASETYSTKISESAMEAYAKAVSNATTESSNWTLSEDWNETTTVSEDWSEEHGYTKEEAETIGRSDSNNWNVSSGTSGSTDTTVLTTTQKGQEKSKIKTQSGESTYNKNIASGLESEIGAELTFPGDGGISSKIKASLNVEESWGEKDSIGFETGRSKSQSKLRTTSTAKNSSWNNSSSYGGSRTVSRSSSVSTAISEKISKTYGYGKSYSSGGSASTSQGLSHMQSSSDEYSTAVTYSTETGKSITSSWTTQSTKPGYHRWVVAGTAHVFAIVGYDMSSQSFFVYTYSVMDDKTHEFEDYSYSSPDYDDEQNGVISFEIPTDVGAYVASRTSFSSGLKVDQNTGTITGYNGNENCVVIPEYMNVGKGDVVKITGISSSAFKGNEQIEAVILSDFITEIPAHAFEGCTMLSGVLGGNISVIGEKAFSGCTSLIDCGIMPAVTSLGEQAFDGVERVLANPSHVGVLKSVIQSGAKGIVLYTEALESGIEDLKGETLTIPAGTDSFELNGNNQIFNDFSIVSDAKKTVLNKVKIKSGRGIPLRTSSPEVVLNQSSLESTGFAMILTADTTNLGLQSTVTVTSGSENTALCKNLKLYEINSNVDGQLVISDKILVCGEIENTQLIRYKRQEKIDKDSFDRLLNSYTLYFDPQGGVCAETSREVPSGTAIGTLPIPEKPYSHCTGWYLSDGKTQVKETTILSPGDDVTVYAHWEENAVSDWIKADEVPEDAKIVNTKWTYDKTSYTESSKSSLDGWTLYDTKQQWSAYGPWSGWSDNAVNSSDSRMVERKDNVIASYTMETYVYSDGSSPSGRGYWPHTTGNTLRSHSVETWPKEWVDSARWVIQAGNYYDSPDNNNCDGMVHDGTAYVCVHGQNHDYVPFFIVGTNYKTQYRYKDRSLITTYYYKKTESLESDTDPSEEENVSNPVKFVQYIAK